MAKFCVKRPFTVLVAVIMVLVLGFVSLTGMTVGLLPDINLPYLMVVTTYPGASPERVESGVTEPLESALGTVTGVKNVTSTSAENYSIVVLEFTEGMNMDSAVVKVSSALNALTLPELCSAPSLLEMSMDMIATMYVGVSYDGMDIYQVSDFTEETLLPYLERQEGVASITDIALVEKTVQVMLRQDKIDSVNDRLLVSVSDTLAEAKAELDKAQAELDEAQAELEQSQSDTSGSLAQASGAMTQLKAYEAQLTEKQARQQALEAARSAAIEELAASGAGYDTIDDSIAQLQEAAEQMHAAYTSLREMGLADDTPLSALAAMSGQEEQLSPLLEAGVETVGGITGYAAGLEQSAAGLEQAKAAIAQLDEQLAEVELEIQVNQGILEQYRAALGDATYEEVESGKLSASVGLAVGQAQLQAAQEKLDSARETYEESRREALESANLDALLDINTLSQLIYAQNFAMPAGYIDDEDDQWLLKVGEEFDSVDELSGMLLFRSDDLGDVRLGDVAEITLIDNAGDSYAKVNGSDAVVLSVYQSSTAGTSDVSKACNAALMELEEEYPGLHTTLLMDQGDYIDLIIHSIFQNLILGAVLAIIILALFLKDPKPTVVVAFSIPFSVLFAIVLMYFSDISLNMISLSGLALGIGMLVDNSVVVIENIYRLRGRGLSPGRAAVQGAGQVASAIVASTLTTICVFLPLLFAGGLTRELLSDMGLTIAYSLVASLLVALTVVPTMSVALLKNARPKSHKWFDKMLDGYEKLLVFCLRRKPVPLAAAAVLLVFCVYQVFQMGIVMLPDTGSNQASVEMTVPEDTEKEDAYALVDQVMEIIQNVDGVDTVGAMNSSAANGFFTSVSLGEQDYTEYIFYLMLEDNADADRVCRQVEEATADLNCEVVASASGSADMSSMMASGLQIDLYGKDLDDLLTASQEIMDIVSGVEGFDEISNGQEDGDAVVQLQVDKDKAMACGLTVAQIYSELSAAMTTEASSTTVTLDGSDVTVTVVNENTAPDLDNLLDFPFETTSTGSTGETETEAHTLGEFATVEYTKGMASINRENQVRTLSVTAATREGYNTVLLSRQVSDKLADYQAPDGVTWSIGGETDTVMEMVTQMLKMVALAVLFIYLVMVAQFQSLLSPFIVLFTIPLAFTGGLLGLLLAGEPLSMMGLMGFLVLAGVVVNNGIVFVDYTNKLRLEGLDRRAALVAAGRTRMRPILMTALTTILAMCTMVFSRDTGSEMGRGMAIVVIGGLLYATLMTLLIVPVLYDILYRKAPAVVDVGENDLDEAPDDAAEFMEQFAGKKWFQEESARTGK